MHVTTTMNHGGIDNYVCDYSIPLNTNIRGGKVSEIKKIIDTLTIRLEDLASCHKDDDCHTIARGVELAIDDVLNLLKDKVNDER